MNNNQGQALLNSLHKIKKVMIKSHMMAGVPHPSIMALRGIKHCNNSTENGNLQGIKMSEISKFMDISKPATTQIINDLEKRGYVKRTLTENDRRVVYIRLTESGNEILDRGEKEAFASMAKIIDSLGENDTEELIRILKKLSDTLANIESEQK